MMTRIVVSEVERKDCSKVEEQVNLAQIVACTFFVVQQFNK